MPAILVSKPSREDRIATYRFLAGHEAGILGGREFHGRRTTVIVIRIE